VLQNPGIPSDETYEAYYFRPAEGVDVNQSEDRDGHTCRFVQEIPETHEFRLRTDMKLEQKITRGRASYVERMAHDPQSRTLTVFLVDDPEVCSEASRLLSFSSVRDYQEELFDDTEAGMLENLLGIDQHHPETGGVVFRITTIGREVAFFSPNPPRLIDVPRTSNSPGRRA
jgi:hypothetical protein